MKLTHVFAPLKVKPSPNLVNRNCVRGNSRIKPELVKFRSGIELQICGVLDNLSLCGKPQVVMFRSVTGIASHGITGILR